MTNQEVGNGIYMCLSIEPIQKLLLGHLMGKYYSHQVVVYKGFHSLGVVL